MFSGFLLYILFLISAHKLYPKESANVHEPGGTIQKKTGHVMISYQWGHQKTLKRIKECLTQNGIKVSFDGIPFYAPGLKGPPGASSNRIVRLSVRLSVRRNSVPLTKKVKYLKSYSN